MTVKKSITYPSQYHLVTLPADGKMELFAPQFAKDQKDKELITGVKVSDASAYSEPQFFEYHRSDIVVKLGPNPKVGRIYGKQIEPYRGSFIVNSVGIVDHFVHLKEEEITRCHQAMTRINSLMTKGKMLPEGTVIYHIKEQVGKKAGTYEMGREQDRITQYLKPGLVNASVVMWVQIHEQGHAIWNRLLSEKTKARWIAHFEKRKQGWKCTAAEANSLKQEFITSGMDFDSYAEQIDEDDKHILWAIHGALCDASPFRPRDVAILCNTGKIAPYLQNIKFADIQRYLDVDTSDVTQYASKNVEELFCESLAKALLDQSLSKQVKKMIILTLKSYGANFVTLKTKVEMSEDITM